MHTDSIRTVSEVDDPYDRMKRLTVLFCDNEMHGPYDFSMRTVSKVDDPYGSHGS